MCIFLKCQKWFIHFGILEDVLKFSLKDGFLERIFTLPWFPSLSNKNTEQSLSEIIVPCCHSSKPISWFLCYTKP